MTHEYTVVAHGRNPGREGVVVRPLIARYLILIGIVRAQSRIAESQLSLFASVTGSRHQHGVARGGQLFELGGEVGSSIDRIGRVGINLAVILYRYQFITAVGGSGDVQDSTFGNLFARSNGGFAVLDRERSVLGSGKVDGISLDIRFDGYLHVVVSTLGIAAIVGSDVVGSTDEHHTQQIDGTLFGRSRNRERGKRTFRYFRGIVLDIYRHAIGFIFKTTFSRGSSLSIRWHRRR